MRRRAQSALLAAVALGLAACADGQPEERAAQPTTTQERPAPAPSTPGPPPAAPAPDREELLKLLVPKGVPTEPGGPADPADLAVVERWLAALTAADMEAAADTFADGTKVQNFRPPELLRTRADRIAFNQGFPCGAEIEDASSVRGYLVVTYRLTDRVDSPCDGPGGRAAGTIKVEGGKMTEWYRLPDPEPAPSEETGPVV